MTNRFQVFRNLSTKSEWLVRDTTEQETVARHSDRFGADHDCAHRNAEHRKKAALEAAAPAMLEALQKLVAADDLNCEMVDYRSGHGNFAELRRAAGVARAAIAAATEA